MYNEKERKERLANSLLRDYLGVCEIDVRRDEYTFLSNVFENTEKAVPTTGTYSRLYNDHLDKMVTKGYRRMRRQFGDLEFLKRVLESGNDVECEYKVYDGDQEAWRQDRYRVLERDDEGIKTILWLRSEMNVQKSIQLMQQETIVEIMEYAQDAYENKKQFMERINNEVKSPMNKVLGLTSIARTFISEPERVQENLEEMALTIKNIYEHFNNVMQTINLRDRKMAMDDMPFDMNNLVTEVMDIIMPLVKKKRHKFNVDKMGLASKRLLGDASSIKYIMLALLSNAVQYTRYGGNIDFSINESEPDEGGYVQFTIRVQDNGYGISESFMQEIFKPYTRETMAFSQNVYGSGLGLAVVKNLLSIMGGDINITSEVDVGTTVVVTLSLLPTEEELPEIEPFEKNNNSKSESIASRAEDVLYEENKEINIMLVDDDEISASILREILIEGGATVDWAMNGHEALRMLEASDEGHYSLVYMDLRLPGIDGFETTLAIRNTKREDISNIPVVAVSISSATDDIIRAKEVGMNEYVFKPVDPAMFLKVMRKYIKTPLGNKNRASIDK